MAIRVRMDIAVKILFIVDWRRDRSICHNYFVDVFFWFTATVAVHDILLIVTFVLHSVICLFFWTAVLCVIL